MAVCQCCCAGASFSLEQLESDAIDRKEDGASWPVVFLRSGGGFDFFSPEQDTIGSEGDLLVRLHKPALGTAQATSKRKSLLQRLSRFRRIRSATA